MKPRNAVFAGTGTTVFETMSALAAEHDAINLGQGFPEGIAPTDIVDEAARALDGVSQQYPPMPGLPALRQAVAAHDARFYGLEWDWQSEVVVTCGATEALAACLLTLIEPGDEVVLIEPLYDSYLPIVRRAGGVPRLVRLEPPDWELPRDALAAAFGPKTKLLLLNNPQNPAARVYDADELAFIAGLLDAHDAYALCDEVYEHLVLDGREHVPLATLPGMRRRCLRIGSAGKIFSLTGWKVGFVCGEADLLQSVVRAHQYLTFTVPPNLQAAVAYGLAKDDAYYQGMIDAMAARRDRLAEGLARIGMACAPCAGTYFLAADFRPLGFNGGDADFCRHITAAARVAAVPVSAFYDTDGPAHFARFCFAKDEAVLDEAIARLEACFG